MSPTAILDAIDAAIAALARVRETLATEETEPADDGRPEFCESDLLDVQSAAERFDLPPERVRRWCREGAGIKRGGRHLASIPHFRRRLGL